MVPYRCFLLGRSGQVQAEEEIMAPSKESALAVARNILGLRAHHSAFELWLDEKIIHTEFRDEPAA